MMMAAKALANGKAKRKPREVSKVQELKNDYNSALDPCIYTGFSRHYVETALRLSFVVRSQWFNGFVILCICLAGVLVGVQTYPSFENDPNLDTIDLCILGVFLLESILKILAEGMAPWKYFVGKEWRWNNFDFVIVVMCLPIWGDALGGNVAVLRMLRLMRVMKLVKKVPQLYMIVMGLIGGIKSIAYILLLLLLVFYLYAIAGIYAFRDNDPWHFGSLFIAMNTLFRMATLEDWTDVMYINYFGCDEYPAGLYSQNVSLTEFSYCNITKVYGTEPQKKTGIQGTMKVLAAFYFITFIVISALVMLSLFVGAITMSMTESMQYMKEIKEEADKKRLLEKAKKNIKVLGSGKTEKSFNRKRKVLSAAEERDREKMRAVLSQAWTCDTDQVKIKSSTKTPTNAFRANYSKLSKRCQKIVEHPSFANGVTYVILLAGVVVGLQTDAAVMEAAGSTLFMIDTIILAVFTTEVILKMVAEGFTPWFYFKSGWNSFDFIIVVGSFLPGSGSLLTVLRLLRLLRVLKLVKSLPQLQVIVSALLKGLGSIGYIGIIMFMVYYVFAILGIILFRDNDPWHFGTLHISMITLFRCSTMEDWSDVMYINMYGCDAYGYKEYKAQGYTCVHTPSPMLAAMYFTVFIIIGALVLITLFIGVVTTSMDEATQDMNRELEVKGRIKELQKARNLDEHTVNLYVEVFNMLDLDHSGSVEMEELKIGLSTIDLYPTDQELSDMMTEVDEDKSGQIDMAEFVEFMANLKKKETAVRRASILAQSPLVEYSTVVENNTIVEESIEEKSVEENSTKIVLISAASSSNFQSKKCLKDELPVDRGELDESWLGLVS